MAMARTTSDEKPRRRVSAARDLPIGRPCHARSGDGQFFPAAARRAVFSGCRMSLAFRSILPVLISFAGPILAQGQEGYFNVESPQVKPITAAQVSGIW